MSEFNGLTGIAQREEHLAAFVSEPALTDALEGFHLDTLSLGVLLPNDMRGCEDLTRNLCFGHLLLLDQCGSYLLARAENGISRCTSRNCRSKLEGLKMRHANSFPS